MKLDTTVFGRFEDPETSSDPATRSLVAALGQLHYAPAPRPQFRDELRAQLVAITERVVAEGEAADVPAAAPTPRVAPKAAQATSLNHAVNRTSRRPRLGRPLGVAAACLAVLGLGLGGAVWKSQSALPGDSLYNLKRASEDVRLSLTSGDADRGHEYLALATTRVDEARALLGRPSAMAAGGRVLAAGVSPQTAALVTSTLASANNDLTSGSTLLSTDAVQSHSTSPLSIMTSWAPSQLQKLHELAAASGGGSIRASALQSWHLVDSALHRARVLTPQVTQACHTTRSDDLGPVACSTVPTTARHRLTHSTGSHHRAKVSTHGSSSPTRHSSSGSSNTSGSHPTHTSSGPAGSGTGSGSGSGSGTPSLPVSLPPLPTKKISPPLSVSSCGASVSVGGVSVGVGSCPSGS